MLLPVTTLCCVKSYLLLCSLVVLYCTVPASLFLVQSYSTYPCATLCLFLVLRNVQCLLQYASYVVLLGASSLSNVWRRVTSPSTTLLVTLTCPDNCMSIVTIVIRPNSGVVDSDETD